MKFGSVTDPASLDFTLPEDHPGTKKILSNQEKNALPDIFVGCAKWNRQELKNFYPRGTKDELEYYATQFNSIELNATFYRYFPEEQVETWCKKVPANFRFFPKLHQDISHRKWLNNIEEAVDEYLNSIVHFKEKLGTAFLQLRDKFSPKHFERLEGFIELWPDDVSLAVELRHPDWFHDPAVSAKLYARLEEKNMANVIVDTAGRRDLLHMRLTNSEAFVRYVGANHSSDYARLDEWVERLKRWNEQGIKKIYFFVHQNEERESPVLAAHFIKKLNAEIGSNLKVPGEPGDDDQGELF